MLPSFTMVDVQDQRVSRVRRPGTVSIEEAAAILGISRSAAYDAVRARLEGDEQAWPTPIVRIGTRNRIPTVPLFAVLGLSVEIDDL